MNAPNLPQPPSHADITARAREIWMERGSPSGQDEAIWLQAEQEIIARRKTVSTAAASQPIRANGNGKGKRVKSTVSNSIDEGALQNALDSVGNLPRSPSSVNLT